jgi:anti-sigma factor RsiW
VSKELEKGNLTMQTIKDMSCRLVQKNLLEYIEDSLDFATSNEIKKHIESCSDCFNLYKNVQETYTSFEKMPKQDPGPYFSARVLARYEKWEAIETNSSHRILRILQPIAASVFILVGVSAGIYLGKNLAGSKTVASSQVLTNESLETYASEYYLDGLGEQSVENLIDNE